MRKLATTSLMLMQILWLNLASCQTDSSGINNEQFTAAMQDSLALVLDVRTASEFKEGHIPGALNINVMQEAIFREKIAGLPKNRKYLLYCRSGKRSANALQIMKDSGFVDVAHLKDGISGWDGPIQK